MAFSLRESELDDRCEDSSFPQAADSKSDESLSESSSRPLCPSREILQETTSLCTDHDRTLLSQAACPKPRKKNSETPETSSRSPTRLSFSPPAWDDTGPMPEVFTTT